MSKDNIFALKKPESIISRVPWEESKRVRPLLEGDKALFTGIPREDVEAHVLSHLPMIRA